MLLYRTRDYYRIMNRIIAHWKGTLYRLIAFEFRDNADGSFYIVFKTAERTGKSASHQKISYHTTGRIKFSGPLEHCIFSDPIFALAEPQVIAGISLHDLDALQQVTAVRDNDWLFEVPARETGHINLTLIIGPDDDAFSAVNALTIKYPEWFRLHVVLGAPLPVGSTVDSSCVFAGPSRYERQCIQRSQALIFFHQKRTREKGLLLFWDARERVGRLIFAVPMRVPPTLRIKFADPALIAEPLPLVVWSTATAELRFKVRGPNGYLNQMPPFESISLDAEL